jgi:hypothetical protein
MPTSSSSSSFARPGSTAPSTAVRPASSVDYRGNIERQTREQKSIGGILNLIVYSLIGVFVLFVALAAYGAHDLSRQIQKQSITVSDLDSRYAAENEALTAQLKTTQEALIQVQAQAGRQQELLLHQQETIGKLAAASDETVKALNQERAARASESSERASETASLRVRVRSLEAKAQAIYRP